MTLVVWLVCHVYPCACDVMTRTPEERTDWVTCLQTAISAQLTKRSTFARSTNDTLAVSSTICYDVSYLGSSWVLSGE